MEKIFDYNFNMIIIGESGVGKTSMALRFTEDTFNESQLTTLGIDYKSKIIKIDGKNIKLQIWDTTGQERLRSITKGFYKGANGVILVYDISDESSFETISNWVKQIDMNTSSNACVKILVGNKCDNVARKISYEKGKKVAQEYSMNFFETSAKSNQNITEVFTHIAREMLKVTEPSREGIKIQKRFTEKNSLKECKC